MALKKVRVSQSVASFKKRVLQTWKLEDWEGIDSTDDLLFFGLYNDRDFDVFNAYQGKKTVFWCGTDILSVVQDYERRRILKNNPAEHYCENEVEAKNLELCGIKDVKIVPSFLDHIDKYPISFKPSKKPQVFMCGHPNRESEYGLNLIRRVAEKLPEIGFHIYGIDASDNLFYKDKIPTESQSVIKDNVCPNISYHGKVPEDKFNEEIKKYHCGLRTNEHDGMSEVTAKSILLGQYPITRIPYEHIWNYNTEDELVALLKRLKTMMSPNYEGRAYWIKHLNQYPWCSREYWAPENE